MKLQLFAIIVVLGLTSVSNASSIECSGEFDSQTVTVSGEPRTGRAMEVTVSNQQIAMKVTHLNLETENLVVAGDNTTSLEATPVMFELELNRADRRSAVLYIGDNFDAGIEVPLECLIDLPQKPSQNPAVRDPRFPIQLPDSPYVAY